VAYDAGKRFHECIRFAKNFRAKFDLFRAETGVFFGRRPRSIASRLAIRGNDIRNQTHLNFVASHQLGRLHVFQHGLTTYITYLSLIVLAHASWFCDSAVVQPSCIGIINVTEMATKKTTSKEKSTFGKDRRRKHHHWLVTVYYADGEKFGRVYTDKDKASRFAERQRRSPVVKSARVSQVS
jgi:hypothetical protein